jgi:hypothetical protein
MFVTRHSANTTPRPTLTQRTGTYCSEQHRPRIRRRAQRVDAVGFFNLLTGPELIEVTEAHLPEHRERLYPPTVALSMFLHQCLDADGSCQKAVNGWAAQRCAEGLSVQSDHRREYREVSVHGAGRDPADRPLLLQGAVLQPGARPVHADRPHWLR